MFSHTLEIELKYFPFRMLIWFWQDTSHHKVAILLFDGGNLVSIIIFEGTILDQAVSCFSGKITTGISKCYVSIF